MNEKLVFFWKSNSQTSKFCKMIYNTLMRPYDATIATLRLSERLKTIENINCGKKNISIFFLKLDRRHMSIKNFQSINWMPINKREH